MSLLLDAANTHVVTNTPPAVMYTEKNRAIYMYRLVRSFGSSDGVIGLFFPNLK